VRLEHIRLGLEDYLHLGLNEYACRSSIRTDAQK